MPDMTVSLVKGEGALRHNNRDYTDENRPDHIDPDRASLNYTIKKESLEDAYEYLFGEAVRKYDEGQSRSDRKYGSSKAYLQKVERSKQQEPFYEVILQFGDMFSHGIRPSEANPLDINDEAKEARDMLIEAFTRFEKQYPNLYFFNVTLHMDEATPHIHADYIPFADGYAKGLERRVAMDKSLRQMGYKAEGMYKTPLEAWQGSARRVMSAVGREHGYTIIETKGKTLHRTVEAYKREVNDIEEHIEKVYAPVLNGIERKPVPFTKGTMVQVSAGALDELEKAVKLRQYERTVISNLNAHWKKLKEEVTDYLGKLDGLQRIYKKAQSILASDPVQHWKRKYNEVSASLAAEKQKVAELIADRKANYTPNSLVEAKIKRARAEAKEGMVNQAVYDVIKEKEKEEACKEANLSGYNDGMQDAERFMCRMGLNKNEWFRDAFEEEFGWDLPAPEAPEHGRGL